MKNLKDEINLKFQNTDHFQQQLPQHANDSSQLTNQTEIPFPFLTSLFATEATKTTSIAYSQELVGYFPPTILVWGGVQPVLLLLLLLLLQAEWLTISTPLVGHTQQDARPGNVNIIPPKQAVNWLALAGCFGLYF